MKTIINKIKNKYRDLIKSVESIGYIDEQMIDQEETQRVKEVFWLYISLLVISLTILNVFYYVHQDSTLRQHFERSYDQDLDQLGILSSEAVYKERYPFINWYLHRWSMEHTEVVFLSVVAMNGTTLIDYRIENVKGDVYTIEKNIQSKQGQTVHLSIKISKGELSQDIFDSFFELFLSSLLISSIFSAIFWFLLIRRVISPIFVKLHQQQYTEEKLRDKHSRQKAKRKLLKHQASHDVLTGLVNRRTFERRLKRACLSSKENNQEHMLMFMDLDDFKPINDTLGHNAGDELLKRISIKIRNSIRANDTLARIGGDEFALLLDDCTMAAGIKVAGNITNDVCNFEFYWGDNEKPFHIGISIGVVLIHQDIADVKQVMEKADEACYEAKNLGGCQISINGRISTDYE